MPARPREDRAKDLRDSFPFEEAQAMLPGIALPPHPALPCFVIGAASGGPEAFGRTLARLWPPFPPIVLIQSIHPESVAKFAEWLRRVCPLDIKVVEAGDLVLPDRVLPAAGDWHVQLAGPPPWTWVTFGQEIPAAVRGDRPFDIALESATRVYGRNAVGVLLTALSRDGVDGSKAIRAAGGVALGQDEATSVIYGPSRIALAEGALSARFPLDELPRIIRDFPAYRDALEGNHPAFLSGPRPIGSGTRPTAGLWWRSHLFCRAAGLGRPSAIDDGPVRRAHGLSIPGDDRRPERGRARGGLAREA